MSRFEDTLVRDLNVIADRATPSSDAWDSILTRITDQKPDPETEIIMLTDNTMPTRRWPLVAAAAAVIALIIGVVTYAGTRDGSDDVPAEPSPTVAPTPDDDATSPDDAVEPEPEPEQADMAETVEPDTEPGVVGDGDARESGDAADAADVAASSEARTFQFAGDNSGSFQFSVPDEAGVTTFSGGGIVTGDVVGRTEAAGTAMVNEAGDGLVGNSTTALIIEGSEVGTGRLIIEDQWTSAFTGSSEHIGTIVAGTGDFLGASGTWTYTGEDGSNTPDTPVTESFGTYTLELILPSEDEVARGWISDPDGTITIGGSTETMVESTPIDDGNPDTDTSSYTSESQSDRPSTRATGLGHQTFVGDDDHLGIGLEVEELALDGLGSGTLEWLNTWTLDGVSNVAHSYLVSGTGAFAGFTGTRTSFGTMDTTSFVTAFDGWASLTPGPAMTRVTAAGTWSDEGYTEAPRDGEPTLDTDYTRYFEGGAVGTGDGTGWRVPGESGLGEGGGTVVFTGEIAGLGSGTLTFEERFSEADQRVAVGVITGGTDDFAGARGTVQLDGGTYEFDIEVPDTPVEYTQVFDLTTSWTDDQYVESQHDGVATFTGVTDFTGQLSGAAPYFGTKQQQGDGNWAGTGDFGLTGTVDGVGTGTLTLRDSWRSTPAGAWVDAMVISGGTGDFAGASGWLLLHSSTGGATGEGRGQIYLP